ncbi:hypothetical protein GQX73_g4578 [Xylaria multiplex]|uniref:C2H2-type domain-containing protein n=1 Tax=Xylaria multiplex TaxID=323545 RepID=A0A7C8ISV3_9PEZI|nr:hypothetical protein GQX73_g4578 [Xylaria multiplex]
MKSVLAFIACPVAVLAASISRGVQAVPSGPFTAGAWRIAQGTDTFFFGNEINASGGKFYINRNASTYCPDGVEGLDCSAYSVYIAPDGSLSYTQAHSAAIPPGSLVTGFSRQESVSFGAPIYLYSAAAFWALCPVTEGEPRERTYQIFASSENPQGCYNTQIRTYNPSSGHVWHVDPNTPHMMAQQPGQGDGLREQTEIQRPSRGRYSKALRNRHQAAINGNTSQNSFYSSKDSRESSSTDILETLSSGETNQNTANSMPKSDGDDADSNLQQPRPSSPVSSPRSGSAENEIPSTLPPAAKVPGVTPASQPISREKVRSFRPISLSGSISRGEPSDRATAPDAPPNPNELREGRVYDFDQENTYHTNTPERTANQPNPLRQQYYAYVEDADDEESINHAGSVNSLAVEIGIPGDHYRHIAEDLSLPKSDASHNGEPSISSSFRVGSSHPHDREPSDRESTSYDSEPWEDDVDLESPSPTPSRSSHHRTLLDDADALRSRLKRRMRPLPTTPPPPQSYQNPFSPKNPNYPRQSPQNNPIYRPQPLQNGRYYPQLGLNVPPYVPSAPGPSYEPQFSPHDPYNQYPGYDVPSRYPNYDQNLPRNPHYLTTNLDYSQLPPPPSTYNPELPLDPTPRVVNPEEDLPNIAPILKTTSTYKSPVSSDPSAYDISFQIPLKSPSTTDTQAKGKNVMFVPGHNGEIHLQQDTLCLDDLRELIRNCRFLDDDLKIVAEHFLKIDCAKFEKKYSSGSRQGYYIEPGTVLRCDERYDQDPSKGAKSVFFCSVPYLQLGSHCMPEGLGEEGKTRTHPARTLMESLYDYDLLDDRDSRQTILQYSSSGQDSILYIPQIWYLLCGSDILISYSQLPLDEVRGDSIQLRDESERSLIAVVTDLDHNQFSVSLKSTDSFFEAIRRIEALRSNAGGNTLHDYDLVLENDEYLIPKKWLDIVACNPLPLLKITLKFRTKSERKSLALIVREKRTIFDKKNIANSPESDDDLGQADQLDSQGFPGQRSAYVYALTSYRGVTDNPEAATRHQLENDAATQHSGQLDESYTPTLVGSLESRQSNARRRIQDLESQGMVVNDILSVSNEPEIFSISVKAPETGTSPIDWGYVADGRDCENILSDQHTDNEQKGVKDGATPVAGTSSSKMEEGKPPIIADDYVTPRSINSIRGSHDGKRPIIPFLQWSNNKSSTDYVGSDTIVRRVLDQVHDRLERNSDHRKIYRRSRDSTLEDLQSDDSPLHAQIHSELIDKILLFRSKTAEKRKYELFQSSKDLIQQFIPINFDHDATKKIWGAVFTICQTLNGILKSGREEGGEFYLVQDYTGDHDLITDLRLTQPETPMKGCAGCSNGFEGLDNGLAHLDLVHFPADHDAPDDSTDENRKLWLRTPHQVQVEARINIFLMFLEDCIEAFNKLNRIADDLHFGSLKSGDTEDAKGYPVFESLVRVFEHITIILTFSCDFMVKVEKTIRKRPLEILNGNKLKGQLRQPLGQIVLSAQKDLEQAKLDIILASKTESRPGDVELASIGPEFMIAAISNGLFFRHLRESPNALLPANSDTETKYIDVSGMYKRYANKLQLQVNQRPQKRLLPDIYALEEELDILLRLNHWQQKFCHDFLRVLDPASYRITTKGRISKFYTESPYLAKTIRRLEIRYNELHSLQRRSEKLRDQLQQSIEIEEESHGNAIRVFTFVTLFFLPLSFVTSFFGMNTTDIRDTDYDQRLFWITSLPTTALVIGVAYLYGYKWENWKESLNRRRSIRRTKSVAEHETLRASRFRGFFWDTVTSPDLENGGGPQRQGTDLSAVSIQSAKTKSRRRIRSWITRKGDAK